MKKNVTSLKLSIVFFALLTGFTSCKSNSDHIVPNPLNYDDAVKTVWLLGEKINNFSYTEFASYSHAFQRVGFQEMSNETKSRIWRGRLDFLINEVYKDNLNVTKDLEEIKLKITPELYARTSNIPDDIDAFFEFKKENLIRNIGMKNTKWAMTTLSGNLDIEKSLLSEEEPPNCSCSTESDWCSTNETKVCREESVNTCKRVANCGLLWWFTCNGFCYDFYD